jgi:hypothetical protein
VAGLPFFAPETITTDHGAVYKNHHLVEVQRVIGANILPARVLRPTDKQAVERAFGAMRSLLFEQLLGYTGVDVADRGVDPEADAVLTVTAMEHLIATWIVKVWQNRQLGEHAPAWDPGSRHSPNTLFAAALQQGGFALQIPSPDLYYELLPAHHVTIHARRGVKIRGLFYDGPALDTYRAGPSTRGGRHKGKWVVRRDPRDARFVFFQDPATHAWHRLSWTGLPDDTEVPAFSDARVRDLLAEARRAGLTPRTDTELLPTLPALLGAHTPIDQWPTQIPRARRSDHARDVERSTSAAMDQPTTPDRPRPPAAVLPLQFPHRAAQTSGAVDAERRRRREHAVLQASNRPGRLGASLRRHSVLALPDDSGDEPQPRSDQDAG